MFDHYAALLISTLSPFWQAGDKRQESIEGSMQRDDCCVQNGQETFKSCQALRAQQTDLPV
jgi:hypothetical protein